MSPFLGTQNKKYADSAGVYYFFTARKIAKKPRKLRI
jgi:hypothetical protein